MDVTIYDVDSAALAMEALRFGNADIAMNIDGGSLVGWNAYDLEVLAADTKDDEKHSTMHMLGFSKVGRWKLHSMMEMTIQTHSVC